MPIQRVRSKWAKTDVLLADPVLRQYVPVTLHYQRTSVENLLEHFGMIYVKPVYGTFGSGVIRLEKIPGADNPYRFQSGEKKYAFSSFDEMFRVLSRVKKPKPYLVQQGIHLLKHDGRRFDLRVMVQHNPRSQWESTGMIGRVAHPRKIVTNYHAGGTPLPVAVLLKNYLSKEDLKLYESRLLKFGVVIANTLSKKFPRLKEIGIDVAIDQQLKPWVLEVNTSPDPFIFKKLPSRSVFRRIYAYAISYGKFRVRKRKA
ncbi:YheC/YheD family protein [Cohnella endophytica]|uniref:YheC/YheD family protein n=1 Tax=Cohnella endophytica TaxID=2419778 RepID=A0A494XT82_9BACL|nr:YheC/YheD family protein [Cohnella endophytica]RKP51299.1 YheC/YheD family protein [Cohnella endophytica]